MHVVPQRDFLDAESGVVADIAAAARAMRTASSSHEVQNLAGGDRVKRPELEKLI